MAPGAWSRPIGWIAVIWVALISVLFMLPAVTPITRDNFNYAPVAVLGVLVLVTIWWLVSARHWFKGPIIQGSESELEAIEHAVGETHLPEVSRALLPVVASSFSGSMRTGLFLVEGDRSPTRTTDHRPGRGKPVLVPKPLSRSFSLRFAQVGSLYLLRIARENAVVGGAREIYGS